MQGRVLRYSPQENRGVISAEDNNRYPFVGSEWQDPDAPAPYRGAYVDFIIQDNAAAEIYLALDAPNTAPAAPTTPDAPTVATTAPITSDVPAAAPDIPTTPNTIDAPTTPITADTAPTTPSEPTTMDTPITPDAPTIAAATPTTPDTPTIAAAPTTPYAQAATTPRKPKEKIVAGIFALVLGGFGIHKFYLGYTTAGIIHLLIFFIGMLPLFMGTLVISIIAMIEGIIYLIKSDEEFEQTYVIGKKQWF